MHDWKRLELSKGSSRGHGLHVEPVAVLVEDQEVVGASKVGAEHGVTSLGGGACLQHPSHNRRPIHATGAVDADKVVDAYAYAFRVHTDLAHTPGGREDKRSGCVVGMDAKQENVVGGVVVHVPRLAVDSAICGAAIGDDHCGAVVFDHRLGHRPANNGANRVDKIGEAADNHRFGRADSGSRCHCQHLLMDAHVERLVRRQHRLGNTEHLVSA